MMGKIRRYVGNKEGGRGQNTASIENKVSLIRAFNKESGPSECRLSYTAHMSAGAWHGELEWIVSIHEAPPARRVTGDSGILTVIHFGHRTFNTHLQ